VTLRPKLKAAVAAKSRADHWPAGSACLGLASTSRVESLVHSLGIENSQQLRSTLKIREDKY
jgi:hypothetical protein